MQTYVFLKRYLVFNCTYFINSTITFFFLQFCFLNWSVEKHLICE